MGSSYFFPRSPGLFLGSSDLFLLILSLDQTWRTMYPNEGIGESGSFANNPPADRRSPKKRFGRSSSFRVRFMSKSRK